MKTLTADTIRKLADFFELAIEKRITTGDKAKHFATFELTGPHEHVRAAWITFFALATPDQLKGNFVYCRRSDADGAPYIGVESVWCEIPWDGTEPRD